VQGSLKTRTDKIEKVGEGVRLTLSGEESRGTGAADSCWWRWRVDAEHGGLAGPESGLAFD